MGSLMRKSRTMTCLLTQLFSFSSVNSTNNFNSSRSIQNFSPVLLLGVFGPNSRSAIRRYCSSSSEVRKMGDRALSSLQNLQNSDSLTYLSQQEAAGIDEILMGPLGFSVDQLMELAGLSVATAIAEVYKSTEHNRVLAICGPGNNGGDGLVAARHLHHFGYRPFVCYPKRTPKPLYTGLVTQLESLSVPFLSVEDLPMDLRNDFDILVDAMFGFSFQGTPRPPFDDLIQRLVCLQNHDQTYPKSPVIVSIDIPSGWHVEEGDISGKGIKPHMLVSLTAPKLCAKKFSGPHHFLGGRFVPPSIVDKFKLQLPPYPGTSMCVRLGNPPQIDISALRENYISPELLEEQVEVDPFDQFQKWFDDAVAASLKEPNAMALSTAGKDGKPNKELTKRPPRMQLVVHTQKINIKEEIKQKFQARIEPEFPAQAQFIQGMVIPSLRLPQPMHPLNNPAATSKGYRTNQ